MIARAGARAAAAQAVATRGAYLAGAAKWAEPARKDLTAFLDRLHDLADPAAAAPPPPRATRAQLASLFGSLGVPAAPEAGPRPA